MMSHINHTKPFVCSFFQIHVSHQRWVTTSPQKNNSISFFPTHTPQHNTQKYILPKKNIDTMISPRSLASSGSNFLGEWNHRTSRNRAPSILHGDAIFLRATNFIFILLAIILQEAAQCARWLKMSFFREWLPFFLVRSVKTMRTSISYYLLISFLPVPP